MTEGNLPEGLETNFDVCLEKLGVAPENLTDYPPEPLEGGVRNSVVRLNFSSRKGDSTAILKRYPVQCKTSKLPPLDQERGLVEARSLETAEHRTLESLGTPALQAYSPEFHCALLEDLSPAEPIHMNSISSYDGFRIGQSLGRWLGGFHQPVRSPIENFFERASVYGEVRKSRISAALDVLDPSDRRLVEEKVRHNQEHGGQVHLHGDLTPKNILIDENRDPYIIDFEFCGKGAAEEDLGFFIGDILFYQFSDTVGAEVVGELITGFLSGYESAYYDLDLVSNSSVLTWAAIALFYRIRYPDSMPGQTMHSRTQKLHRTAVQLLKTDCSDDTFRTDILTQLPV